MKENMNRKKKDTIYVIINPASGTKSKDDLPDIIHHKIDELEYDIKIFFTEREGHGSQLAAEAAEKGVACVIAVGGDGTVNEIAKELVNTDTILGIIPSGSGNGLARDLHIPINYQKAVDIIKEGNVKKIDYGIANDNIFFCTCGVGFDAEVSEKALSKSSRGVLMYAKNMISTFVDYEPKRYKVTTNDGTFEDRAFLVTCANARQYGYNAFIAPHADIQDGKMNISILRPLSPFDVPQTAIQMFSKNLSNNANLIEMVTDEAHIQRDEEGPMHLDGNAIPAGKDIHIKVVKQALNVLVPTKIPKSKEILQSFITDITRWI